MKKIDFHIHTIPVEGKDADFKFDIDKFQEFIHIHSIDAVAITNHNLFDLEQFKLMRATLKCTVFPGIEINFESGHLLLISEDKDLEDFSGKCELVTSEFQNHGQIT